MALINIEYGSLASSNTMNTNFAYLDNRITESSDSIMTNISSIYSNIATINARLAELSEQITDSVTNMNSIKNEFDSELLDTRNHLITSINNISMLPDWTKRIGLGGLSNYNVPSNGFIMILPNTIGEGNIIINNLSMAFKQRVNNYDNSSQLVSFPVKKGDIVTCTSALVAIYFVPTIQITE